MKKKTCTRCRQKQDTEGVFPEDKESPDGFGDTCRVCLDKIAIDASHARNQRVATQLDEQLADEVAKTLAVPLPLGPDDQVIPDTTTLYGALVKGLGGTVGFANLWRSQFLASKPGSPTRTKMLESISKLSIFVTEQGGARQLADMEAAELKSMVSRIEAGLAAQLAKRIIYTEPVSAVPAVERTGQASAEVSSC